MMRDTLVDIFTIHTITDGHHNTWAFRQVSILPPLSGGFRESAQQLQFLINCTDLHRFREAGRQQNDTDRGTCPAAASSSPENVSLPFLARFSSHPRHRSFPALFSRQTLRRHFGHRAERFRVSQAVPRLLTAYGLYHILTQTPIRMREVPARLMTFPERR